MVIEYVSPVPAFGVPESVAVPSLLSTSVTPPGSAPGSVIAGIGNPAVGTPPGSAPVSVIAEIGTPVVVTLNVPAVPTVNVALFALVIAGGWLTVSVKLCVAFGVTPLFAVIVIA